VETDEGHLTGAHAECNGDRYIHTSPQEKPLRTFELLLFMEITCTNYNKDKEVNTNENISSEISTMGGDGFLNACKRHVHTHW
jgi:hypothetical protein